MAGILIMLITSVANPFHYTLYAVIDLILACIHKIEADTAVFRRAQNQINRWQAR